MNNKLLENKKIVTKEWIKNNSNENSKELTWNEVLELNTDKYNEKENIFESIKRFFSTVVVSIEAPSNYYSELNINKEPIYFYNYYNGKVWNLHYAFWDDEYGYN